ncbi:MAG: hypothetical protein IPK16_06360 [Anaerolineales bacterium]|nr:hypothetical protein [Anaerolineales bacterium]
MQTTHWKHLLWGCGICCGVVSLLAACRPVTPPPPITVELSKADDYATVTAGADGTGEDDRVALEVFGVTLLTLPSTDVPGEDTPVIVELHSASGIGGATITWPAGNAPTTLQLHLHLSGLEELELTGGASTVQASVSSSPPFPVRESLIQADSAEQTLAAGDAYWTPIEIIPAAGETPAIPLKEGYFAITIPSALLQDADGVLKVQWVDFYR